MDNTAAGLQRALAFVGLAAVPADRVAAVVAECSFENMRRMEEEGAAASGRLRAGSPSDPESFKVRRGKVGGYRDYLGDADLRYIEDLMRRELPAAYGYEPHRP